MKSRPSFVAVLLMGLFVVTAILTDVITTRAQEIPTPQGLTVVKAVDHGLLCHVSNTVANPLDENSKERPPVKVMILSGSPEQMGTAHGELMRMEMFGMASKISLVSIGYTVANKVGFNKTMDEVMARTGKYTPDRFFAEIDALGKAGKLSIKQIRQINFFPELFHCSGVAVGGSASVGGEVIHARVLDYMKDLGIQQHACLIVHIPDGYNAWVNVSYAGFVGSVTAMNEHGLAMGEMGGEGEGKWDGLPMNLLIRRIMEECRTVDEAIALMKAQPLTCDYYYILSDAQGNMAAIEAIAESDEPVRVFAPGQSDPRLPGALDDVVYISGPGERADTLFKRLKENYGSIDAMKMIEMIKRPVAMKSNLHDAVFLPKKGDLYWANAFEDVVACNEPYSKINLKQTIDFYRQYQNSRNEK